MSPVISIIVPVYNAENYLYKCITSLISQTYQDIEIICVDDGSKDNSIEILRNFSKLDYRIKVISQANKGPATARNVGLENATGDYVMFCDADDYYEPEMCEKMQRALFVHDADLVMCDCNINVQDEYGNIRSEKDIYYHRLKLSGYFEINSEIYKSINMVLWDKIFKMSLIREFCIKFPDGYEQDDNCFVLKYLAISKVYFGLNEKLYNYNICNPESIMNRFFTKNNKGHNLDFIYSLNDVLSFVLSQNISDEIITGFKEVYIGQIKYFGSFLSPQDRVKLSEIMYEKLKSTTMLDDEKLIKNLKAKNIKGFQRCLRRKTGLSIWQRIFSLRNKSNGIKVLTILGLDIPLMRVHKMKYGIKPKAVSVKDKSEVVK